jgi:hypothetical protein
LGGHMYAARQNIVAPRVGVKTSLQDLKNAGITTGTDSLDILIADSISTFYSVGSDLEWVSNVIRGDVGVNMPLTQNMDLEVSGGLALLQYSGPNLPVSASSKIAKFNIPTYDANDISMFLNARLFSTLVSLNGEIVPVFKLKKISVRDYDVLEVETGLGANVTLDRGFFWAGLSFIDNTTESPTGVAGKTRSTERISLPLSFGIERNVVWEWLVLRVGFRKVVYGSTTNQSDVQMLYTNPEADMTVNDHVGGGIGINIEEKLKIDAVLAEDILYKWGNLVSGNSHHILSRITATYSF